MSLLQAYRGGYNSRRGWFIQFSYSLGQIRELKRLIPYEDARGQARAWCPERGEHGEWWVADEYAEQLPLIWPGFRAHLAAKTLPGFG